MRQNLLGICGVPTWSTYREFLKSRVPNRLLKPIANTMILKLNFSFARAEYFGTKKVKSWWEQKINIMMITKNYKNKNLRAKPSKLRVALAEARRKGGGLEVKDQAWRSWVSIENCQVSIRDMPRSSCMKWTWLRRSFYHSSNENSTPSQVRT